MLAQTYDLVIIGSGPAGSQAALHAAGLGLKCAIVEANRPGGVGINMGANPSKALLKNASVAMLLRQESEKYGFQFHDLRIDYARAIQRSRAVTQLLSQQLQARMESAGVAIISGFARITAPGCVQVSSVDSVSIDLSAGNILVATGSSPMQVPGIEIDGKQVVDYRAVTLQEWLPSRAVIIGGGALGVEYATLWNAYGVDVTILEITPHLVPYEDGEISLELEQEFEKGGIHVITSARLLGIRKKPDKVVIEYGCGGSISTLLADQVLEAVSFLHNSTGLGLEALGVNLGENGRIQVDNHMSTNVPGIWAAGDVTGLLMLAVSAEAQGITAVDHMLGRAAQDLDFEGMPKVTYSQPQIASFGITQQQAIEKGTHFVVGKAYFAENPRAIGLGIPGGWVKLIGESQTGRILGGHLIGDEVVDLLPLLTHSRQLGLTIRDLAVLQVAHPSLSEIIIAAAKDAAKQADEQLR